MSRQTQTPQALRKNATRRALRMMPVVDRVAFKMKRRLPAHIDVEDLIGAGRVGLAVAIQRYAQHEEDDFDGLAISRIRGAIIDFLRSIDPLTRCQRRAVNELGRKGNENQTRKRARNERAAARRKRMDARKLALATRRVDFDKVAGVVSDPRPQIDEVVDDKRQRELLRRCMGALAPRLRTVLAMRLRQRTYKDIGDHLGVTESRVCQLQKEALAVLRVSMNPTP